MKKKILLFSFLALFLTSFTIRKPQISWISNSQPGYNISNQKPAEWASKSTSSIKNLKVIDSAINKVAYMIKPGKTKEKESREVNAQKRVVTDKFGAIIRGDTLIKKIALVFTGDEFADGGAAILEALLTEKITSSFFLTGRFYSTPEFNSLISRLKVEGHYLGAHSDQHLLYCDWVKRDSLLITRQQFSKDLSNNYRRMQEYGVQKADARYFIPPYEWYNSAIVNWAAQEGLHLVNFSPGTRSTADYTWPELGKSYRSSDEIYQSIIEREEKDPNGLNGFILLVHIGVNKRRTDKFYNRLPELLQELKNRGYTFERIDQMLD